MPKIANEISETLETFWIHIVRVTVFSPITNYNRLDMMLNILRQYYYLHRRNETLKYFIDIKYQCARLILAVVSLKNNFELNFIYNFSYTNLDRNYSNLKLYLVGLNR